eukprot:scaffold436_cov267-Pinguiococcus_pyrenoidosus.AAC.24
MTEGTLQRPAIPIVCTRISLRYPAIIGQSKKSDLSAANHTQLAHNMTQLVPPAIVMECRNSRSAVLPLQKAVLARKRV